MAQPQGDSLATGDENENHNQTLIPKLIFNEKIKIYSTKTMYLVRGLPGSGKSTFCRNLLVHILQFPCSRNPETGHVVLNSKNILMFRNYILSTDDFFSTIVHGGNVTYTYDPSQLKQNHEENKTRARIQAKLGITPLFIDNTNVTRSELDPYCKIANNFGYRIQIVEPEWFYEDGSPFQKQVKNSDWLFKNRNSKNIAHNVYENMNNKYETL